jgi:hypothetical protein
MVLMEVVEEAGVEKVVDLASAPFPSSLRNQTESVFEKREEKTVLTLSVEQ